jgi:hypothetical protein
LSLVFANLVQGNHALIIYDAITSTRDKIGVLYDVIQQVLKGEPLLATWITLRKKLERMARRRNKIVHAYTILAPKPGLKIRLPVDPADGSFEYLAGPGISKSELLFDPAERLRSYRNVHQLKHLATAFELLDSRVAAFNHSLIERHNATSPPSLRVPLPKSEVPPEQT